jgi:hypothetical protein
VFTARTRSTLRSTHRGVRAASRQAVCPVRLRSVRLALRARFRALATLMRCEAISLDCYTRRRWSEKGGAVVVACQKSLRSREKSRW